jgi:hypothetical protein
MRGDFGGSSVNDSFPSAGQTSVIIYFRMRLLPVAN